MANGFCWVDIFGAEYININSVRNDIITAINNKT